MFIIFDLDDTLIETSGFITPFKLERALGRMVEEGLELESFPKALDLLLELDRKSESAQSAIEEFIEINEFDPRFTEIALHEVYHTFSEETPVFPVEDAAEVLSDLSNGHKISIVSIGRHEQQIWKLKKAGIDTSFFCKILVLEEKNKKKPYQALIEEMDLSPRDVVVCGDRIPVDLSPAKQLGCTTVHMKKGRGAYSLGGQHEVDFTITQLSQMRKILQDLSGKASFD